MEKQQKTNRFYNLFNPEDNVLTIVYPIYEGNDAALGQHGIQKDLEQIDKPSTPPYYDVNVQNEVQPGQDPGYIGFRKIPVNKNLDEYDGVIDIVVQQWLMPK